ncbi:MAG: ATP synthase F0 subunit B [Pseudomonadota bacterium]
MTALNIDYTVIIQIVNFLVLLFILNILLYRPVRKILGKRKEEIDSCEKMIGEYREKIGLDSKALEENMIGARREGYKVKEELKGAGLEQEKDLVQGAIGSTAEKFDKAKKEIEGQIIRVRQSLENEVSAFSKELAEKILGRSV